MSFNVTKNCGNPDCLMNGTLHGHQSEETPEQPPAETEQTEQQPAPTEPTATNDKPYSEMVAEAMTKVLQEAQTLIVSEIPKGPVATIVVLDEVIDTITMVRDEVAAQARLMLIAEMLGGEPPDCGDPDCPNHAEARAKAAAAAEQQPAPTPPTSDDTD